MQPVSRFEATKPAKLHALISDLRWRVQVLDADIQEEEQKARVFDPASASYPMLALTLRGRRENLIATIAALKSRMEAIAPSASWDRAA